MIKLNVKTLIATTFATLILFSAANPLSAEDMTTQSQLGKTIYRFLEQDESEIEKSKFSTTIQEDEISDECSESSDVENSDQIMEKHKWTKVYQTYGDELITVKFPSKPTVSQTGEIVTSVGSYKHVGYVMTSYNPVKQVKKPHDFFQFALQELSTYPSTLGSFDMWKKNGQHFMELKTVNLETGVTSRVKYIVTSRNLYVLETRYVHGADERHEHFFDSFEVLN